MTGETLDDRYELHALIGEGTFGRVYHGFDRRLARPVAVKVIKPWWAEDPEWTRRFENEARLLARLSDPRIVQVYDIAESASGSLYFVAELVAGESLADRLRRGPLAVPDAARIARELCEALARAHAQRIVHRDVKPANILLTPDGSVKVGDFGVARLTEGSSGAGGAATAIGTPQYMSPEQARGEHTTAASDVYGAGVVLFEMLAGHTPFPHESAVQVAVAHLHEDPPALPARVPVTLDAVVRRALEKQPHERYCDAGDMAVALSACELDAQQPRPLAAHAGATRVAGAVAPATRVAPRGAGAPAAAHRARHGPTFVVLLFLLAAAVGFLLRGGAAQTTVPRVSGLPRGGVQARLNRSHLRALYTERFSTTAERGIALEQRPAAGERLAEGSTVAVTLSGGPQPVAVPEVVGRSQAFARTTLRAAGLLSRVVRASQAGARPFTVLSQDPAPAARAMPGSTISLRVAQPPRLRLVTRFAGARSVPFRIHGTSWRVDYRMSYAGTCTLVFVCLGPKATVYDVDGGRPVASFDLSEGTGSHSLSMPGTFELHVAQGRDSASWAFAVRDFY